LAGWGAITTSQQSLLLAAAQQQTVPRHLALCRALLQEQTKAWLHILLDIALCSLTSLPLCCLLQEQTKAWLHILLDIAVMICVMLSDPSLPHAPAPLPTLVVTAFLGVMDMVSCLERGK